MILWLCDLFELLHIEPILVLIDTDEIDALNLRVLFEHPLDRSHRDPACFLSRVHENPCVNSVLKMSENGGEKV